MPRWFTLTPDHLKAAGHGSIVDSAQTVATGGVDPVAEAIANATARVQRAIGTGNVLDADPTKIPASFKGVAEKLAIYDLMERIGLPLSESQKQNQRDITSDLNRTADNKLKVELPDNPATTPTMQDTGIKAQAINVPRRLTGRGRQSGLG
jgi:hypothetical protein